MSAMTAAFAPPHRRIRMEEIKSVVAARYGTTVLALESYRREECRPRQVAMYLARTLTRLSLPQIGKHLGGRDHTTIRSGILRIEHLLARDPNLDRELGALVRRLAPPSAPTPWPMELQLALFHGPLFDFTERARRILPPAPASTKGIAVMSTTKAEQRVLDLYDRGRGPDAIAEELGVDRRFVSRILSTFAGTAGDRAWNSMVRHGSRSLLAAIRAHHPEMCPRAIEGGTHV